MSLSSVGLFRGAAYFNQRISFSIISSYGDKWEAENIQWEEELYFVCYVPCQLALHYPRIKRLAFIGKVGEAHTVPHNLDGTAIGEPRQRQRLLPI